jgi:hypothetical protein
MIIPDKELEDEIKKFLSTFMEKYRFDFLYHKESMKYISSETFYIEFINYLVKRGLEINVKK